MNQTSYSERWKGSNENGYDEDQMPTRKGQSNKISIESKSRF